MDKGLLMDKVIAGTASSEEQKQFNIWLSLSDANREEFEDVKWLSENADYTDRDPDDPFYDGWKKIRNRMTLMQKRKKLKRVMVIVISVIVLLTALYFVFHQLGAWNSSTSTWSSRHIPIRTLADASFLMYASDSQI